jgi:hypothetical protein
MTENEDARRAVQNDVQRRIDQILADATARADEMLKARESAWKAWRGRHVLPVVGAVIILIQPLLITFAGYPVTFWGWASFALAAIVWWSTLRTFARDAYDRGWQHSRWYERFQATRMRIDRMPTRKAPE